MKKKMKTFGEHFLVEFIGCAPDKIRLVKDVKPLLLEAAKESRATVVKHFFHQYKPEGVTGIILISESHFSIHTWPEDKYVAFDILTCGKMFPQRAVEVLKRGFGAKKVEINIFSRGFMSEG